MLAIVIIGGLISSLLLSRLVTPVLYKLLPPGLAIHADPESVPESGAVRGIAVLPA